MPVCSLDSEAPEEPGANSKHIYILEIPLATGVEGAVGYESGGRGTPGSSERAVEIRT